MRLGTASLAAAHGGPFINLQQLNLRKVRCECFQFDLYFERTLQYAERPALARALADYALIVENDAKSVLELGSHCLASANFKEWWWKERMGRA